MIDIFYHLYIPSDNKGLCWNLIFDEQMRLIEKTRLHHLAKINVVLVLRNTQNVNNYNIHRNKYPSVLIDWVSQIKEYIELNHAFAKIVSIIDTNNSVNLYEGPTLKLLHEASKKSSNKLLYLHAKGISHPSPNPALDNWRSMLNYFLIENWTKCLTALDTHDIIAVMDQHTQNTGNTVISGNFFWANSSYISKLENPLDTHLYSDDIAHHPGQLLYRFGLEKWVTSGNPRIHWAHCSNVDHYHTYYPRRVYHYEQ